MDLQIDVFIFYAFFTHMSLIGEATMGHRDKPPVDSRQDMLICKPRDSIHGETGPERETPSEALKKIVTLCNRRIMLPPSIARVGKLTEAPVGNSTPSRITRAQ